MCSRRFLVYNADLSKKMFENFKFKLFKHYSSDKRKLSRKKHNFDLVKSDFYPPESFMPDTMASVFELIRFLYPPRQETESGATHYNTTKLMQDNMEIALKDIADSRKNPPSCSSLK